MVGSIDGIVREAEPKRDLTQEEFDNYISRVKLYEEKAWKRRELLEPPEIDFLNALADELVDKYSNDSLVRFRIYGIITGIIGRHDSLVETRKVQALCREDAELSTEHRELYELSLQRPLTLTELRRNRELGDRIDQIRRYLEPTHYMGRLEHSFDDACYFLQS